MANSPRLGILLMSENVLQKEIIFNEAVVTLDAMIAGTVLSETTSIPTTPADGDCYLVASGAGGLWNGQDHNIAFWFNGWHFITPPLKARVYNVAANSFYTKQAGGWTTEPAGTPTVLEDLTDVAVGSPADGQVLTYRGSDNKWSVTTLKHTIGQFDDVSTTGVSAGQVLAWSAGQSKFVPTTLTFSGATDLAGLDDVDISSASEGFVAIYHNSELSFRDPSTILSVGNLNQIGNVNTTGAQAGDQLTWNGSAWGPSTRVTNYAFAGMVDGPGSMAGKAGQFLVINDTEDHLTYADAADVITAADDAFQLQNLRDVPNAIGTAGQTLAVNPGRTGFVYVTPAQTIAIKKDGAVIEAHASAINFTGGTVTDNSGEVTVAFAAPYAWHHGADDLGAVSTISVSGAGVGVTNNGGTLELVINGVSALANLSDVDGTVAPTAGSILQYDTATSKWRPGNINAIIGNVTGIAQPAVYEQGAFAPPTPALFPAGAATRVNMSGNTLTNVANHGLVLVSNSAPKTERIVRCMHDISNGTAPWTVTCRVQPSNGGNAGAYAGIVLSRHSNSRVVFLGAEDTTGDNNGRRIQFSYHEADETEHIVSGGVITDAQWLQLSFDGTVISAAYSMEGVLWHALGTVTANTALLATPDMCGIGLRQGQAWEAGTGALWTFYDDPDYPAASRTMQGYVNVALANLTDVDITGLSDGKVLAWNAAASKWKVATAGSGGSSLPSGGTSGQLLAKNSNTDSDVHWINPPVALPTGGMTGQILKKNTNNDGDASWSAPPVSVPSGGTTGQVLGKVTSTDGDVAWITPAAGGGATELSDLTDVDGTVVPSTGQVLTWNGTKWAPSTLAEAGVVNSNDVGGLGAHLYWRITSTGILAGGANSSGPQQFSMASVEFRRTVGGLDQCVSSGGTSLAGYDNYGGHPSSSAFDGNVDTYWISTQSNGNDWLQYHFTAPKTVSEIALTWKNATESWNGPPSGYVVSFSDDGSTFTPAWSVTGITSWSQGETKTSSPPTASIPVGLGTGDKHTSWRIKIYSTEANDGPCDVQELTLSATIGGLNQAVAGSTGTAFASATESGRSPSHAFDQNTSTSWGGPTSFPAILGFTFNSPKAVISLTMQASSDGYWVHRTPLNFDVEFLDDDDGTTWHLAWSETGHTTAWSGNEIRTFSNPAPTHSAVPKTIPTGGTTGQILYKKSGSDYDVGWENAPTGGGGSGGGSGSVAVGAHKWWRLRNLRAYSAATSAAEIRMYANTADVTAQTVTTASASSEYDHSSDPAAYAVDGSGSTFWAAREDTAPWFDCYFATAITLAKVAFQARNDSYSDQTPWQFEVWYSDDGQTYFPLSSHTSTTRYNAGDTQTWNIPLTIPLVGSDPDLSPPLSSSWDTIQPSNSLTVLDDPQHGMCILATASAAGGLLKIVPTGWSSLAANLRSGVLTGQYGHYGIALHDSTMNRQLVFDWVAQNNEGVPCLTVMKLSNWSYASRYIIKGMAQISPWLRVMKDGSNFRWQLSLDGLRWQTFCLQAANDWLGSVSHYGFCCAAGGDWAVNGEPQATLVRKVIEA